MIHMGVAYGHCATVALVADGALIFCQSEERLNRLKGSCGFPDQTFELALRMIGGRDRLASCTLFQENVGGYRFMKLNGFKAHQFAGKFPRALIEALRQPVEHIREASRATAVRTAQEEARPEQRLEADRYFEQKIGIDPAKLFTVRHHDSHVFSVLPFLPSIDEPTLIFTLDGEGDHLCASVGLWADRDFAVLDTTPMDFSLGQIYSFVTSLLGFKSNEHEYKVMGLAAYAKPDYFADLLEQFRRILWVEDGRWRGNFLCREEMWSLLIKACEFERFDAVAGALQQHTEECMLQWIQHWVKTTGVGRIGCAGGVFMNVKANQRIAALPEIEQMVVVPSCGDESTAIGAAVFGSLATDAETPLQPATQIYLGRTNTPAEVEAAFGALDCAARFEITRPADITGRTAELLAAGNVVARCTGPMEFGARALGNRSILAHPSRPELVVHINQAIKNRDFWMPFAPSILAERMVDYVVASPAARSDFMMVSFETTPRGKAELAAALHAADGTCRPQCVTRQANPDYHALISKFAELTGIGAVLNTSFNLHGEPIVMSPADAISTVDRSGLRYLVLDGGYLLEKRSAS